MERDDKVEAMKQNYHKLRLDCLVILGGNGTQKTANLLREEGLNIIHLPKTIDNDIWGTDMTFGFYSAVNIATEAIDCIHTTASPIIVYLLWKLWAIKWDGLHYMQVLPAAQMSS